MINITIQAIIILINISIIIITKSINNIVFSNKNLIIYLKMPPSKGLRNWRTETTSRVCSLIASVTSECILWLPVGPSLDPNWPHFHA